MKRWLMALTIPLFAACNNIVEIEGTIKVKGSMPHTYLVIEDSKTKKDIKIENPQDFKLYNKQNQIIKAKIELKKEKIGASFPAVGRIIEVK